MLAGDDPSAIARTRRAKGEQRQSSGLDGGAAAAGMLCVLIGLSPVVLFGLPWRWAVVLAIAGLFLGSFLAARLSVGGGRCGICHAGVVLILFYTLVAAVATTTVIAPGEPADPPTASVVTTLTADGMLLGVLGILGVCVATIGGVTGALSASVDG